MLNVSSRSGRAIVGSVGAFALVALAGCSSGDPEPSPTPTVSVSVSPVSNSTAVFDKTIQQELADVGCYQGAIDGLMGPGTDAAVVAFQQAKGLEVDGELGPETEASLKEAADAGEQVCGGSASPSASPSASASPTISPDQAACTAVAIQASLPSGTKMTSFVCADGGDERWAAGDDANSDYDAVFIMKADGLWWVAIDRNEVCGTASAGVPAKILDYCDVS